LPKVSIVVTTYNREQLVSETINGILNQTVSDFELIIVDNFSNYDFFALIKTFGDKRIRAYQNLNEGIIAVNRNFGIKQSRGKYIAFCDDDDIWKPHKLETQLAVIRTTKSGLVSSNVDYIGSSAASGRTSSFLRHDSVKSLVKHNQIVTSSVLVEKYPKLVFPENKELIAVEDYSLWLSMLLEGVKFAFAEQPLLYLRKGEGGAFSQNPSKKHLKVSLVLLTTLLIHYEKMPINLTIYTILKNLFKYLIKQFLAKLKTDR
jgi:teichuronic acid biosynthesis glycosyltransferase TuaG